MYDETIFHFEFFCKIYKVFGNISLLLSKMSENKSREEYKFLWELLSATSISLWSFINLY